jgi:hypothetical protein
MTLLQNALLVPKLYIGADVHKKSWYINLRTDVCHHKSFSMKPNFEELYAYVTTNFPSHEVSLSYEPMLYAVFLSAPSYLLQSACCFKRTFLSYQS